jgi:hypothetical protein
MSQQNKGSVIDVWGAYETGDEWGRFLRLIGIFRTEQAAKEVAAKRGFYGGPGDVQNRKAIWFADDQVYLLDRSAPFALALDLDLIKTKETRRKFALAKLTDEEKELLGVKEK